MRFIFCYLIFKLNIICRALWKGFNFIIIKWPGRHIKASHPPLKLQISNKKQWGNSLWRFRTQRNASTKDKINRIGIRILNLKSITHNRCKSTVMKKVLLWKRIEWWNRKYWGVQWYLGKSSCQLWKQSLVKNDIRISWIYDILNTLKIANQARMPPYNMTR